MGPRPSPLQVGRLQHHASLVIFGGNNENESALSWYDASKADMEFYKADYVKLYIDTVHTAVKETDPMVGNGRAWVDSSPSNGVRIPVHSPSRHPW